MVDVQIRMAVAEDLSWLVSHDRRIPPEVQAAKVSAQEVLLAERGGQRVGLLRLDFLWSKQAYIDLLWVLEPHRRMGVGKAFLRFLDVHLSGLGCRTLLSSSQVDEPEPQVWHRRVGFSECGVLTGINEGSVGELFFRRRVGDPIP